MSGLSPSAVVRSQARKTLKGNYVAAIASFVILLLPIFLIKGLATVIDGLLTFITDDPTMFGVLEIVTLTPITILLVVLLSPLFNGFVRIYYEASFTREFNMNNLFYYFGSGKYHRAVHLNLSFAIRLMFPAVLFFLPLFAYYIFCFAFMDAFVGTVLYKDFEFILTIMSSILLIIYSLKYFLVMTMFCTDDSIEARDLFRMSKEIMKDQKGDATKLFFSFTPWMLLCLLIIPALYVVPYMTQSLCIGAKWMTVKGK